MLNKINLNIKSATSCQDQLQDNYLNNYDVINIVITRSLSRTLKGSSFFLSAVDNRTITVCKVTETCKLP